MHSQALYKRIYMDVDKEGLENNFSLRDSPSIRTVSAGPPFTIKSVFDERFGTLKPGAI